MGKYNIINLSNFKRLISLLPEDFDVYGFEFDNDKATLKSLNRSKTVYLKIEVKPEFFKQYEITYPNKIILTKHEIEEGNIDFNAELGCFDENIFMKNERIDKTFNNRRYCPIGIGELQKPITAYKDTWANILIENNDFESIFDLDVIKKALLPNTWVTHLMIALEGWDSNIAIKY